jgi:predicted nucleotidyltransferase
MWRKQMAERIAREVDHERLGVQAMYLFGSVKNAIAGPASDIDLLIHFTGTAENRAELMTWLDGWSQCLAELNFHKTGYRTDGLLDVHLVTDQDIDQRSSYAVKIGAVTDAAYPLPLK